MSSVKRADHELGGNNHPTTPCKSFSMLYKRLLQLKRRTLASSSTTRSLHSSPSRLRVRLLVFRWKIQMQFDTFGIRNSIVFPSDFLGHIRNKESKSLYGKRKKGLRFYYFFPSHRREVWELAVGSRSHPIFVFRNGRDDHFKPSRYYTTHREIKRERERLCLL